MPRRLWGYSPHRAIVALAFVLMTVAVASGALGAFNSNRAESKIAVIADRDVALLAPLRQMQTSVNQYQEVVDQAFSETSVDPATVAAAIASSTTIDQTYLTLERSLALPYNAGLAPRLDALDRALVDTRAALAATGAGSPVSATVVAAERQADQNLAAALGTLQATVTSRLLHTTDEARTSARRARNDLLWCLGIGLPFGIVITTLMARKAISVERREARRDAAQALISQRNEFEARLQQALEMAKSEPPAFDMVAQALDEAAPGTETELLLADSSRAHFRQVLVTPVDRTRAGCGVVSPHDCPAASSGQTKTFALSTALGACPNLRGRACSALCVPVSIAGNSAGVIHVTAPEGQPPSDVVRRDVEVIARRTSERFAMLRAFEVSQTQANTDSLTGLLTRRSLESSIRELEDSGFAYAVAYGDLDHFKQLNDVFGHSAGDRALRAFSQVLRDGLRPSDVACRFGGEEFVVVLPGCPVHEAVSVLERVRQHLAQRLTSAGLPAFTVSFGVATSEQTTDFERTINLADEALLQAKATGRDRIVIAGDDPLTDVERPPGSPAGPDDTGWNGTALPLVVPPSWEHRH